MISDDSDLHNPAGTEYGDATPPDSAPPTPEQPEEKPARRFLGWPPPGLESIQGAGLPTAGFIGIGGLVLILPLLVSIGINQRFTSPGPFGGYGWPLVLFSSAGLLLLAEGLHRLFRILRTGNLAVKQGHGWLTIAQTASDSQRDMGFLLQGARGFSGLDAEARQAIVRARLAGMGGYLAAALCLLLGFLLGVFLAARGVIGNRMLWVLSIGPSLVFFFTAIIFRIRSALLVHRSGVGDRGTVDDDLDAQIADWIEQSEERELSGTLGRGPVHRALSLRIASTTTLIIGLVMLIPLLSFIFVGTYIPAVISKNLPRFQGIMDKAYIAEVVREYRPAFDPGISAIEAGEALQ
ncbi:hypothetical protein ACFL3H_09400, partial [Gemmatimonadota bacterium]